MLFIEIVCDTNDADYITKVTKIESAAIEQLRPLIEAVKANKAAHNWPDHEYIDGNPQELYPEIDPKIIEFLKDLCPYWESGVHTIKSILVYERVNEKKLI